MKLQDAMIINESNPLLKIGSKVVYWNKNAKRKVGKIGEAPEKGRGLLILSNGVKIKYNQFESWWEEYVPGVRSNTLYIDKDYKSAGDPEIARTPKLNPFKFKY